MKTSIRWFFLLVIVLSLAIPAPALAVSNASTIPTFSITAVVRDSSVTIYTYNFPAYDKFEVLMNKMGTQGKNGIKVATVNSGKGGSFSATFNIPSSLKGLYQIAIRLQSVTRSGYYSYNWFYNNTTGSTPVTKPVRYPYFYITGVVRNKTVTITGYNFPANDKFEVLMNYIGTKGVKGIKVATYKSGKGGKFTATFNIPPELKGQARIAIRLQSVTGSGYYAYNWFYNTTT